MSDVPLPEPWDYCYEWDGPYGTRKFSQASHNGNRPDRSVPLYTADKMHAHAAAVSADLREENARLREALARAITTCFTEYDFRQVMSDPNHFVNAALKGASHE
jgi:hypothetical protein